MSRQHKILIERGRLVVSTRDGKTMILGGEISKDYPGRIDVHMGDLIGHMTYAQALAEFKKEGVGVEAFDQAFSKLKKNSSSSDDPWIVVHHYDPGWEYLGKAQTLAEAKKIPPLPHWPYMREEKVWWSQRGAYAIGKRADLIAAGINVSNLLDRGK